MSTSPACWLNRSARCNPRLASAKCSRLGENPERGVYQMTVSGTHSSLERPAFDGKKTSQAATAAALPDLTFGDFLVVSLPAPSEKSAPWFLKEAGIGDFFLTLRGQGVARQSPSG